MIFEANIPKGTKSIALCIFLLFLLSSNLEASGTCQLPESWKGSWFEAGYPEIHINSSAINVKGRCLESDGDSRFLFEDRDNCYRCLFIVHQKHPSVLQYKETYCEERDSLSNLCSLIPGDGQLHSMFRRDAQPVECPFRGQFTFTYSRGHGECRSPVSRLDSCVEPSKLFLRYQACPDVHGTESLVEQLECLAVWKEGSTRYLVGRLNYQGATSDEDRYRCFVYERVTKEPQRSTVLLAQSGDATCSGLTTATEGSRTLRLTKAETDSRRCRYPSWLLHHPHWQTLDGRWTYSLHKNITLRVTNATGYTTGSDKHDQKITCYSVLDADEKEARIVAHVSSGCNIGYICLSLYRREMNIIEFQTGEISPVPEEACTSYYFNPAAGQFTTLLSTSHQSVACPMTGRFGTNDLLDVTRRPNPCEGRIPDLSSHSFNLHGTFSITSGCSSPDTLLFHDTCPKENSIGYLCRSTWDDDEDPRIKFIIVTPLHRYPHYNVPKRLCITIVRFHGYWRWILSTEQCLRPITDTNLHTGHQQINSVIRIDLNSTFMGQCTGIEAPVRDSRIIGASPASICKVSSLGFLLVFLHIWR